MFVPGIEKSEKVWVKMKAIYSGLLAVVFLFPSVLAYYSEFRWAAVVYVIHAVLISSTLLLVSFEKPKERVLPRFLIKLLHPRDERKLY